MDDPHRLAADLGKASFKVVPAAAAVVAKGAHNVKQAMVDDARSTGSTRHFADSISYDLSRGGMEAEIGPDKDRPQGALGNVLYFGGSQHGPVLDIDVGLREEAPRFEKHLGDAAVKSLGL